MFGKEAPLFPQFISSDSPIEEVENTLIDREEALQAVKAHLAKAQSRMKKLADKNRKEVEFQVGDLVLVKLQPYRQLSVASRFHNKLCLKFFGPYKIIEKFSKVAYKSELSEGSRIHNSFHISKLKKFLGPAPTSVDTFSILSVKGQPILYPISILDRRVIDRKKTKIPQSLVLWSNSLMEDSS